MNASQDPSTKLLQAKSRQEDVTQLVVETEAWLVANGRPASLVADATLVLAEVLNNVVEHSYQYDEGGDIELETALSGSMLYLTVKDKGREMGQIPTPKAMDGPEQDFADLPEGGFGWHLILTLASDVTYTREGDQNRLQLTLSESD